jgi:hypothetical protein
MVKNEEKCTKKRKTYNPAIARCEDDAYFFAKILYAKERYDEENIYYCSLLKKPLSEDEVKKLSGSCDVSKYLIKVENRVKLMYKNMRQQLKSVVDALRKRAQRVVKNIEMALYGKIENESKPNKTGAKRKCKNFYYALCYLYMKLLFLAIPTKPAFVALNDSDINYEKLPGNGNDGSSVISSVEDMEDTSDYEEEQVPVINNTNSNKRRRIQIHKIENNHPNEEEKIQSQDYEKESKDGSGLL